MSDTIRTPVCVNDNGRWAQVAPPVVIDDGFAVLTSKTVSPNGRVTRVVTLCSAPFDAAAHQGNRVFRVHKGINLVEARRDILNGGESYERDIDALVGAIVAGAKAHGADEAATSQVEAAAAAVPGELAVLRQEVQQLLGLRALLGQSGADPELLKQLGLPPKDEEEGA